jgi:hypothetical protein
MPNNSPPLSLSLSFGASIFKLPTCHLPATYLLRVCLYHPANNQPQSQSATRNSSHADVPSLRLHGLQLSLMPITALPLCFFPPFWPSPARALVPRSLSFVSSSHPFSSRFLRPRRTFCSSQVFINFADRDLKQGTSVVIESYT